MLKIFWDKDNIAFIGDSVNSSEHSHCVLQIFLSLDEPLRLIVENERVDGKCIIVNKNVKHAFSCDNGVKLSVLVEPSSSFAKELSYTINGNYRIFDKDGMTELQQKASLLVNTTDTKQYAIFIQDLAEYLGIARAEKILDDRIIRLLELLHNCNCYDHTIEYFADRIALSPSRLSHLFREQVGIPLKSYILFHQLETAVTEILNGKSITDAAMLAGFDSPSHFAATVKKQMGMPISLSVKDSEFLKVFV